MTKEKSDLAQACAMADAFRVLSDDPAYCAEARAKFAQAADTLESLMLEDSTAWAHHRQIVDWLVTAADHFPEETEKLVNEAIGLILKKSNERVMSGLRTDMA